jgi:hypothetical protein
MFFTRQLLSFVYHDHVYYKWILLMLLLLRYVAILALAIVLFILNTCGTLELRDGTPIGIRAFCEMRDENGNVISFATHPHLFKNQPLPTYYYHGWPLTSVVRMAYKGCSHHTFFYTGSYGLLPSSRWPIDDAEVVSVRKRAMFVNLLVACAILSAGWYIISAMCSSERSREDE